MTDRPDRCATAQKDHIKMEKYPERNLTEVQHREMPSPSLMRHNSRSQGWTAEKQTERKRSRDHVDAKLTISQEYALKVKASTASWAASGRALQQAEEGDPSLLLSRSNMSGVLCPVLGCQVQERYTRESLAKGHKGD